MSAAPLVRVQVLPNGTWLDLPAYQTAGSAGFDLVAAVPEETGMDLAPGKRALVPTGLAMEIPSGHEGQVRPRSGLAVKHGITVLNAPGTIDCDYRGEISVPLINLGDESFTITRGMRIAQMVIAPYVQVALETAETLSKSDRNTGGFGSTGA